MLPLSPFPAHAPSHILLAQWTWSDEPSLPGRVNSASFIGIVVAISGNILISLALNCQKLAHKRLDKEREVRPTLPGSSSSPPQSRGGSSAPYNVDEVPSDDDDEQTRVHSPSSDNESSHNFLPPSEISASPSPPRLPSRIKRMQGLLLETGPLLVDPNATVRAHSTYGSSGIRRVANGEDVVPVAAEIHITERLRRNESNEIHIRFADDNRKSAVGPREGNETDYLKSKLWWFGFALMNIGELGNFISYAFAPASVVAPLGAFALIANCFLAPLILKERFRKQDILGVFLSIVGAVTVVLSANPSDARLTPSGLLLAIKQPVFIGLAIGYAMGMLFLIGVSSRRWGREHVFVDVGLCALFGGFTVLSTKAISSLLTLEWWNIVTEWITYPVALILVGTGVGQIKYLNRALMKFDSKSVIPTQFVLFNLSAIVCSAVFYGDFRNTTLHQMVTFLYGCGATFAGVVILTRGAGVESGAATGDSDMVGEECEPSDPPRMVLPLPKPILRGRASTMSLVGLSPAQRVLLLPLGSPTNELQRQRSRRNSSVAV